MEESGDVSAASVIEEVVSTQPSVDVQTPNRKRVKNKDSGKKREKKLKKSHFADTNLVSGTFLKSIFYLNPECRKYCLVGVFSDLEFGVYVLIIGQKSSVFLNPDALNQLIVKAGEVTDALAAPDTHKAPFVRDALICVRKVFGKRVVVLCDGKHTLMMSTAEWIQFINNLPCITRQVNELFACEDLLKTYIAQLMVSEEFIPPPEGIPGHLVDRLFDETEYFRRWPNGGRS